MAHVDEDPRSAVSEHGPLTRGNCPNDRIRWVPGDLERPSGAPLLCCGQPFGILVEAPPGRRYEGGSEDEDSGGRNVPPGREAAQYVYHRAREGEK